VAKDLFDKVINRKGTYSTQWDFVEDRFGKEDLLPFTISDMDFAVSEKITDALQERLDHPIFGYTRWNHPDYKNAIINWYNKRFNSTIDSDWIIYSPSVMYSVARLIELTSNKGDGVIIQTPAYDAFFKTINASKRELIANPLIYNNGFYQLDFDDLENKLSRKNNKVLLICNPHNPTGRIFGEEDLKRIINMCKKYDVFLISDEIHMDILRDQKTHHPVIDYYKYYEKIALCSSTSKSFNVPGLGGSYLFILNEELRSDFQFLLKNRDGLSSASIFGITATIAAYSSEGEQWIEELNKYIDDNILFVEQYLKEEIPKLTFINPEATYLAWIDISDLPFSMQQLQKVLVGKNDVAIMNGKVYGGNGELFLRLNVGCPRSKLKEGLKQLKISIEYLKENN